MIVALGLSSKVATIILGCIFSILFSDFRARGPIIIPTPPIVALTEFFYEDAEASVHLLTVSWYLISSPWVYLCCCMHIMSLLWSIADAVSSKSCPILFKILTLIVAICIVRLHFSNFCFSLSSVADFSNTVAKAPTSGDAPLYLPTRRAMQFWKAVWVWVIVIFRWLFLFSSIEAPLIDQQQ